MNMPKDLYKSNLKYEHNIDIFSELVDKYVDT